MIRTTDANHRHRNVAQRLLNLRIVKVSNNPVTQPVFNIVDPAAEVFINENIPVTLRCL